jgi:hypothetical protein
VVKLFIWWYFTNSETSRNTIILTNVPQIYAKISTTSYDCSANQVGTTTTSTKLIESYKKNLKPNYGENIEATSSLYVSTVQKTWWMGWVACTSARDADGNLYW